MSTPRGKFASINDPGDPREAYAVIANQLRAAILSGELTVGEKLPEESQLSEMFGVSRSTVREALRVIGSQRLIRVVRGKGGGTFVTQPRIQDLTDGLSAMFGLVAGSDECTIEELVEARQLLEVHAAGVAATSRDDAALLALETSLPSRKGKRVASKAKSFESNYNFHVALLRAAGNRAIEAVAVPIYSTLHYRIRRESAEFPQERNLAEHWALYDAIAAGDAAKAETLMSEHLRGLEPVWSALDRGGRRPVPSADG